ncbi:hypothetical protein [Bacillus sp. MB2021]|uniref:hypothetical protein n=1 Tax=Bacillus sp. MB2021 TaxID=1408303 RepID=UPI0012DD34CB|nr:hypothetical protein [Bacillus sp. MB2021]
MVVLQCGPVPDVILGLFHLLLGMGVIFLVVVVLFFSFLLLGYISFRFLFFLFIGLGFSVCDEGALIGPSIMAFFQTVGYELVAPFFVGVCVFFNDGFCSVFMGPVGFVRSVLMFHLGMACVGVFLLC